MSTFDPDALECLAAIVEEGGFERAAQRLSITQSAVSQRLRALEQEVKELRSQRSVTPDSIPNAAAAQGSIPNAASAASSTSSSESVNSGAAETASEPFAWGDFTWVNGSSRQTSRLLATKYFTPQIDIDAKSVVYWQGVAVTAEELEYKMSQLAQLNPQPEVHLRPNQDCQYAVFANVLSTSKRRGLSKMAVIGSEQFVQ